MKTRIREMVTGIWVIDEIVISGEHWASGSYITWDNRFSSKEKALSYLRLKNTEEQQIKAWQHLIDTGLAWTLQGWFGRNAQSLIEQGICTA